MTLQVWRETSTGWVLGQPKTTHPVWMQPGKGAGAGVGVTGDWHVPQNVPEQIKPERQSSLKKGMRSHSMPKMEVGAGVGVEVDLQVPRPRVISQANPAEQSVK